MGIFFERYQKESCCLCGEGGLLTGEHKIKASALRKIFGNDAMFIGHFDGESTPLSAQGPKSRAFHFSARMCSLCNGARTQGADREFDRFHALAVSFLKGGQDPSSAFSLPRYAVGTEAYLNVFRYFSKLLCCHIAESCGPRPLEACEFAIGNKGRNIISLQIDADPTYEALRKKFGQHRFAGHGGLLVPFDSETGNPSGFRETLKKVS
ncbi:hypothetical protein [Pseudomonas syringae]|uniref:hypothetical protein n=1 Tax=Pseudomonas syringae TaxID=317 RepID=UPI0008E0486F|nr:hypothetical protein [Pseudomonas syringae]SFP06919.1 hypothetical protein SAMN05444063_1518 [Pseudomonas syringae]